MATLIMANTTLEIWEAMVIMAKTTLEVRDVLPTRCCVTRLYPSAVILRLCGTETVALLHSHMIILVKEEIILSLALTKDPGNVIFQLLIFV